MLFTTSVCKTKKIDRNCAAHHCCRFTYYNMTIGDFVLLNKQKVESMTMKVDVGKMVITQMYTLNSAAANLMISL